MRQLVLCMLALVISASTSLKAQQMKLGLWKDGQKTERFMYLSEELVVWDADGQEIEIPAKRTSYFTLEKGKIKLSTSKENYGLFNEVKLIAGAEVFNLKSLIPEREESVYDQGIVIGVEDGGLHLVNYIGVFDSYVAGVVEAESGKEQKEEYYRLQSVISRTYALSNMRKHEHEGFNLCDQVHCQVYKGIARFNSDIDQAAIDTKGQVIVDSEIDLITAAFHSNCGGNTVNSEHVWSKALPYLVSRKDIHCGLGAHAEWEMKISKVEWEQYLMEKSASLFERHKPDLYKKIGNNRHLHYPSSGAFALKEIRGDWKLKSTYFDIELQGDSVLLIGRGFGHGVGLCQEGAMGMVEEGYGYQDILHHYYTGVHLIHLSVMDFFKEN